MAKKAAPVPVVKEKINKAAKVAECIEELGIDASGADIKSMLVAKYPSLADWADTSAFNNYVSNQKKKLRGESGGTTSSKKKKETSTDLTLSELLRIGEAVADQGDEIHSALRLIKSVEEKTGLKIHQLSSALDGIKAIQSLKIA